MLGGPGARRIPAKQLRDVRVTLQALAQAKHRDWSLLAAMVDPDLGVRAYQRQGTGERRYFCPEELAAQKDPQDWQAGAEVTTQPGLTGRELLELRLAKAVVADFSELQRTYHFEEGLPQARPNWGYSLIEQLASPEIAGALLFVAWFALMIEFMSPGLSGAGFVSGLCFLLFFWAKFLHGTAGWLEILLFMAGVLCVAIEMFAIPGLGIFGIGGGVLVVVSIVLASQTFVLPANVYQWQQLPASLFMVVAAGTGAFGAMAFMRRAVTQAPVFRRVSLESPDLGRREQVAYQEALVHLDHLVGQRGVTTTQLTPGGKARFGDELVNVLSDGDVIPAGTVVLVAAVRGNEVLVRSVE
jgi:membrane-bound ClpP family serine protease